MGTKAGPSRPPSGTRRNEGGNWAYSPSPLNVSNERIGDGPPPLPPRPGCAETKPASPRGSVSLRVASLLPCVVSCSTRTETETKRKRNGNYLLSAGTETETTQATQGRNGNEPAERTGNGNGNGNGSTTVESRKNQQRRKPEKEGEITDLLLPSLFPVKPLFRSFPVPIRATIKTIFPLLRYVSAHFEKKVKKYL